MYCSFRESVSYQHHVVIVLNHDVRRELRRIQDIAEEAISRVLRVAELAIRFLFLRYFRLLGSGRHKLRERAAFGVAVGRYLVLRSLVRLFGLMFLRG